MYTVTITQGAQLIDVFTVATFEEVCAYARLYWSASPTLNVTWTKD